MIDLADGWTSGWPALFAICAISGILFPVPEDVPLLYAGLRLQSGELAWGPTLAAAFAGVLVRDLGAYALGRVAGAWLLDKPLCQRLIGRRRLARASRLVEERGGGAVIAGRFLIGLRAPVFFVAGAMGVPLRRFAAWDALGLAIVVPGSLGLGWFFGPSIVASMVWAVERSRFLTVSAAVGALGWLLYRRRARRLAAELEPEPAFASADDR